MIHLILLSGGSGSRLWPLSNNARSKQFLKVLRDENGNHVSMVQRVFSQIERVNADIDITIATCESQENSIETQVNGKYSLVLEPERRDTAPAIMLACAHLWLEQSAQDNDTVIVMPIDTFAEQDYYNRIIDLDVAVQSGESELVLLGVEPTYPSEKYGYIIPANCEGNVWRVKSFKEKPDSVLVERLIEQGGLWNCGVFAFKLSFIKQIIRQYVEPMSFEQIRSEYSLLPKISFDYEVVEKTASVSVAPYRGGWKDLGTWNTLTEEMSDLYSGRVVVDEASCEDIHVINETGFPLVIAGLKNAVVVATPDGLLVSGKEESAKIKQRVAEATGSRPMYEQRRWGEYRVLDLSVYPDGNKALTKELVLNKGKQLSYQKHARRSEVWTVVSGIGKVVLDGVERTVKSGSVINVASGVLHAAYANSELHIIEVQIGDVLVEEDIVRVGDYWKSL